jgi:hypothetical protein
VNSLLVTASSSDRVRSWRLRPGGRLAESLVVLGYVVAAVAMTWRLWAHPSTTAPTASGANVNLDIYLSAWYMRYVATALAHGHLPALVTTALNSPQGVNAMWNTSLLAPAFLLAPVTLIAGPVASLTVLLTLGFAGSAASMYVVLRRWSASVAAAALGGALFGFMPAMMVAGEDHYHLQFAVLPPLIIDAVLMLVTGRGRPVRTGLWLGLLISLQLFIAEEMLADTVVAGAVIVLVLVLTRPWAVRRRVLPTLAGVGTALALTLLICGRALWVQFHGPLAEHGSPWNVFAYGYPPSAYVTAPNAVLLHSNFTQYLATTGQHPIEEFGYLGWPLQIALIALPFIFWRDVRIRVIGLAVLLMEWLAIGGHSTRLVGQQRLAAWLLPWHWLQHLPVLNQLIVVRLAILTDGAAAVVLALVADRTIAAVRGRQGWLPPAADERWRWPAFAGRLWRRRPLAGKLWRWPAFASNLRRWSAFADRLWRRRPLAGKLWRWPAFLSERRRRLVLTGAATATLIAIVVPIIPRPEPGSTVSPPTPGWTTVISRLHLPAGAPVLELPLGGAGEMEFQATTGEQISITGGYCIAPDPAGQAIKCDDPPLLSAAQSAIATDSYWMTRGPGWPGVTPATAAEALVRWNPAAVVITMANYPDLRNFMIGLFGRPTAAQDDVMGWRVTPQMLAHLPAYAHAQAEARAKAAKAKQKAKAAQAKPAPSQRS